MATKNRPNQSHRRQSPKRDQRFRQLLALAREGNDTAIHDLWAEFQFNYHGEDSAHE